MWACARKRDASRLYGRADLTALHREGKLRDRYSRRGMAQCMRCFRELQL